MAGRFISFEGGEGSGKSTQARLLANALQTRNQSVVLTREPGGTGGAEAVRQLLVTGDPDRWTPWAEACLVNAARADHVARVVRPALDRGDWVICDRYVDSTRAYQGAGKGLVDAELCALHGQVTNNLWPDTTIVMMIDATLGLRRAAARVGSHNIDSEARFEAHSAAFHARVAGFFNHLAIAEPARCHGFDADQSADALAQQILATVWR
ncbi:MAG: dTMP kinase [Sandarakinorhabdus sp.]|nr:dTMP kinase [Sandarakinorhabdus sp.]